MTPQETHPFDDLAMRARALDACCISDAMDSLGLTGVVDGILPMWPGAKLAGRVVTTKLALGAAPAGAEPMHLGARAIARARRGDVIVVDNEGRRAMGSWGGLLSRAASLRGVAGVVLDGACRDVDEARELVFPAFARCGAVRTARQRVHEESVGAPVRLAGVPVSSGDLIVADGSGIVVIAADQAGRVISRAEELDRREGRMRGQLREGIPVQEVLSGAYERMLHRDGAH